MICPKCHGEVVDGATFCTLCGESLSPDVPTAVFEAEETPKLESLPEIEPDSTVAFDAGELSALDPEEDSTDTCSCCGSPLPAGAQFCAVCGTARPLVGETTVIPASDDATRVISDPETMFEFMPDSEGAPDSDPVFDLGETQVDEAFAAGVDRRAAEGALWNNEAELRPLPEFEPQPHAAHFAPASGEHFDALTPDAATKTMNSATATRVEHEQARAKRNNKRTALAVTAIVAVVALACGGVFAFSRWQAAQQAAAEAEQAAADERIAQAEHAVTVKVTTGGWDTAAGASRLPIKVSGTDVSGNAVDEVQFIDSNGEGLSLRQGEYALAVAASPISVDGTLYSFSNMTVEVSFTTKDEAKAIDATGNGGFELSAIDAAAVTDEQIAAAYEYAQKDTADGAPSADALKAIAVKRRDDAVAAAAKVARTITASRYTVEVPESWAGQVSYSIDNKGTLHIYSSKYSDYELCRIYLQTTPSADEGDIEDGLISNVSLGGGYYAQVWVTRWAYPFSCIAAGKMDDGDYGYSHDKAKEIVDLQTGGTVSLDDVIASVKNDDGNDVALIAKGDTFLKESLVSTIKATS